MDSIVSEYAAWLESWGASTNTIEGRTTTATTILSLYGVEGITVANLQTWLARKNPKTGEPLSRWTRATNFSNLKCFCAWMRATGRIQSDPVLDLKSPTRPKSLPRPLSEAEAETVLHYATGNVKDWIMLAMLAGLRAHEIAKLRGEDVTPEGIYVEGKGGVRATVPTHPLIWQMAQRYPRIGYWYPSPRKDSPHITRATITTQVGFFFRQHNITGSIHRCRHVYGTRLLRAGVNIRTVQTLMRHASLQTTAIYTAVDEDELRKAIGLLNV